MVREGLGRHHRRGEPPGPRPRVWSVEAAPLLSIGGLDAPASHQLYRVSGATRLPDGRIAASSAGTFDVRVYGPQGDLLATFGSEGDGPGEFRDPVLVGRRGADTLVVFDATLSRLLWIHTEEGLLASVPVSWSGKGYPVGRHLVADGSLLVGGRGVAPPVAAPPELSRDGGSPRGKARPGPRDFARGCARYHALRGFHPLPMRR